jgi:hypothetical protein
MAGMVPPRDAAGNGMSDPKKPADEPKAAELSSDELDAATGGAVDSFIYFQNYDSTFLATEVASAVTKAPTTVVKGKT